MPTIYDVFLPLRSRIKAITSNSKNVTIQFEFEYAPFIYQIELNSYRFKPSDRIAVSEEYYQDITILIEKLWLGIPAKAKKIKRPFNSNDFITFSEEESTPELVDIPDALFFIDELEYYLSRLKIIIEDSSQSETSVAPNSQPSTVINLPVDFKIKDFKGHFVPKMTRVQTAMLLSLLRDSELIPYYSVPALSKIGMVFFGTHYKTIEEDVNSMTSHLKNEVEASGLKGILEMLINKLESQKKVKPSKAAK